MNPQSVTKMIRAMEIAADQNPEDSWCRKLEHDVRQRVLFAIEAGECERPDLCMALLAQTSDIVMFAS